MTACNIFRNALPAPSPGVCASLKCIVSGDLKTHTVHNVANTLCANLVWESQCKVQWPAIFSIKDIETFW